MLVAQAPAQTPVQLRASIVAAASSQHSVHYVSASTSATVSVTIACDAGSSSGIQQITFRKGKTTGHVTVVVVGRTAYLRGDAFTLADFIGIKTAGAKKYANTWIVVPSSHPAFAPIAAAVTLVSAIDELGAKTGTLTRTAARLGGKSVVGVRSVAKVNGVSVTDTLLAQDAKLRLPVQELVTHSGFRATNTFSRWNEPVSVKKPGKAVPIATVLATASGPAA